MADLDPRQELFASYYTDPTLPTFSNAYQSALKAGYSEEYAQNITREGNEWVSEIVRDLNRLKKAEENLDMFLNYGEDPKIQADITKFVAGTLGRKKYHSKSEQEIKVKELPKPLLSGITDVYTDNGPKKTSHT